MNFLLLKQVINFQTKQNLISQMKKKKLIEILKVTK